MDMLISRTLDAAFLNTVANAPDVRPHIGGEGPIDLTALVADPANIALVTEHGGWVLARHEPGIYELHTLFLPQGRGAGYFRAAKAAIRYVFVETDAREIVTRIPVSNRRAALAAAHIGFRERFNRLDAWMGPKGLEPVSYRALTLDDWMFSDDAAHAAGEAFHETLAAAKHAAGSHMPIHPDDRAHDQAAGAAYLMVAAGNARKGVWAYNRWARLAGYQTIEIVSDAPVMIDIRDAVLGVRDGAMEVIQCR